MRPYRRGIEKDSTESDDLLSLELMEDLIHHPIFTPSFETLIDGVPVSILLGKLPPGTARGEHIEERIEYRAVTISRRLTFCW